MFLSTDSPARTYRWSWWTILLNFLTSLYLLPMLALVIGMLVFLLLTALRGQDTNWLGMLLLLVLGPFLALFCLAFLWLLLFPLGRFFFSYLRTSETGLEYRYWPTYGARCTWQDVDRLGKYKSLGFIPYDVLYLKQAEPIGLPIMMSLRQRLGFTTNYMIPLTGIHGWPDGNLAAELRRRAPQLWAAEKFTNEQPS